MEISEVKKIKQELFFLSFAFLILFLSLFPYWIFKEFSALGWYDEVDAHIPWYYAKNISHNLNGFLHGYAGGSDATF